MKIPPEVGYAPFTSIIAEQRINAGVTVSSLGGNYFVLLNGYTNTTDYVPVNGLVAFRM